MTGLLKKFFCYQWLVWGLIMVLGLSACTMGSKAGASATEGDQPQPTLGPNAITVSVKDNGYTPEITHAKPGEPAQLVLVSNNVHSCSLSFVIPEMNYEKLLPVSGQVVVDIPAHSQGAVLRYTCSMGMYTGEIHFDKE